MRIVPCRRLKIYKKLFKRIIILCEKLHLFDLSNICNFFYYNWFTVQKYRALFAHKARSLLRGYGLRACLFLSILFE